MKDGNFRKMYIVVMLIFVVVVFTFYFIQRYFS